ncbi:hypothetical protein PHYBOEH_011134 [Phytophthora boehmeriae]|uniref:Temptin Cys/Cys disulfide domain-containing protein n=1 Tax=Phytophthora boehmeriae TaxID=109152 RepID=A0A8T1WWC6_9STRA|nr:hypothetical protein PHYBOEH_011134 [Phytophthora boehmeriae]
MKISNGSTLLILGATLVALLSPPTEAKPGFVKLIPNGANVPNTPALGHTDGTGDSTANNAFGKAFDNAGREWTTTLCKADTDGDGQTNGQELGDPCCEWTEGAQPRWTTGVSHPSDAKKTSNSSLWANIDCSSATAIASTSVASRVSIAVSAVLATALSFVVVLNFAYPV